MKTKPLTTDEVLAQAVQLLYSASKDLKGDKSVLTFDYLFSQNIDKIITQLESDLKQWEKNKLEQIWFVKNPSWKDIFNTENARIGEYGEAARTALNSGYKYFTWNTLVYNHDGICLGSLKSLGL